MNSVKAAHAHKHPKDALPHIYVRSRGIGGAAPNKQNEARRGAAGFIFWRCGYHKALLANFINN